ncbi:MAG: hypothetical protein PHV43_01115 [Candidatus Colwellbacteria bacterium]|nr:hypothetical protein [Candidatus Colwellbacteria bacterium]
MRPSSFQFLFLAALYIWLGTPTAVLADTDADFGELAVTGDMSTQEKLTKKIELTRDALTIAIEKTEVMQFSLESLRFEDGNTEAQIRNQYLDEVAGYLAFYQERKALLSTVGSLEEIDALIQTIIEYRETVYAPSAKNVLEFILVFSYGPEILNTASERYDSIVADVERLEGLKLIESGQFAEALGQCRITLDEAGALQTQAKELISAAYLTKEEAASMTPALGDGFIETEDAAISELEAEETTESLSEAVVLNARDLVEGSLNKIKGLYGVFIETGQEIKETLGI